MGAVVLDSSVVLGILDPQDALHAAAARRIGDSIRAGDDFSLPTSVLAEVLVAEARRGQGAVDERRRALEALFGPPRILDAAVAEVAACLRASHRSVRLPDALVVATGITDDAEVVLTADKRWSGLDRRVEILVA